jgi:hypothetical protein
MASVGGRDQLRGDADASAGLAHAPFKDVRHTERLGDSPDVLLPAFECERGRARDHLEVGDSSERVDDFLGQTVAEPLVIPARTHVCERQNGDRPAWVGRLR